MVGGMLKKERMYIYKWLIHDFVQQKMTALQSNYIPIKRQNHLKKNVKEG